VDVDLVIVTRIGDPFPYPKALLLNFAVKYLKRLVPPWSLSGAVRYADMLEGGADADYVPVDVKPDDVAFLQYTGGTTGRSKGAMLTHRNMVSNVLQAVAWARSVLKGPGDRAATPLPLYHVFSLMANLLCFVELGGTNVLITNPRDLGSVIKELRRAPVNYLTGVNTLFNALLGARHFRDIDFSELRVTMGGGTAVQRSVAEAWQEVTGRPIVQGYGLTEASPIVSVNPLDATSFSESIGLPLPSTEISIRDDDGAEVAPAEIGEICVRGPQVMKGYWNDAEATAEVMFEGGWLRTGDVGRMDEHGFLFIEDRLKDLIIVSGFNVYPNELESVASMHPGILEAAAVGVPDDRSGEAIKLFLVRKDPNLTAEAVIEHFRQQVTGYKVPDHIVFKDELPKSNVGKVLRRELRDD
jgi:long-chain acyl-CoA synthetase